MDWKEPDREWKDLQSHIEGFLGRTLKNETGRIEYKPRFSVRLPEMSSALQNAERPEAVS